MTKRFIAFLICEIAYVASVRGLVFTYTGSRVAEEIYWSLLRLLSFGVLFWIYRGLEIEKVKRNGNTWVRCLPALGILVVPVLVGRGGLNQVEQYVFAATSLVVGLREEVAYRGILQSFLRSRLGVVRGLLLSNVVFVVYHYGVQPFTMTNILQLFFVGMTLGIVFEFTGSLLLVVALHTIYDAVWAFTPLLDRPFPGMVGSIVFALTLALLARLTLGRQKQPKVPEPTSGLVPGSNPGSSYQGRI